MQQLRKRAEPPAVNSLRQILRYASRKAPELHDYQMHELIDGRALRLGEKEKVLDLLKNKSGMQWDNEQNEIHVAAAYVCIRLRLDEALDIIKAELEKGIESPHVRFMFELAVKSFEITGEFEYAMKPKYQLIRLLEMRNSKDPGERKLAEIIIDKAEIKYGTVVSW
jgi:hypothetical protein